MADPEFERDPEDFEEKDFDREESELEEMQRRAVAARRLISIGIDVKRNTKPIEQPTLRLDPYKKASDPVVFDRKGEFEPVFVGRHYDVGPINLEDYQIEVTSLLDEWVCFSEIRMQMYPLPESFILSKIAGYVLHRSKRHYPKDMPSSLVEDLIFNPEKYEQLPGVGLVAYRNALASTTQYIDEREACILRRAEFDARFRPLANYNGTLEVSPVNWEEQIKAEEVEAQGMTDVKKTKFEWVVVRAKMKRRTSA